MAKKGVPSSNARNRGSFWLIRTYPLLADGTQANFTAADSAVPLRSFNFATAV